MDGWLEVIASICVGPGDYDVIKIPNLSNIEAPDSDTYGKQIGIPEIG